MQPKPRGLSRREFLINSVLTVAVAATAAFPAFPESARAQEVDPQTVTFVKAIDPMKLMKDLVRDAESVEEMDRTMARIVDFGATHVSIVMPLDLTSDGIDPTGQIRQWVGAARRHNLSVIHRYLFNEAEGTYDVPENNSPEFRQAMIDRTRRFMIENADLIQPGDIWASPPEPQNLGVNGLNWCGPEGNLCLFSSVEDFNGYIQNNVISARQTLAELGKDIEVICCGFDGFVTAGDGNPDWRGKSFLTQKSVDTLNGVIAVDHYPQIDQATGVRTTYEDFFELFENTWPNAQLILTEFGVDNLSIEDTFRTFKKAAEKGLLRGAIYWLTSADDLWDEAKFQALKAGFASLPSEVASQR